jgi:hypothetical protein
MHSIEMQILGKSDGGSAFDLFSLRSHCQELGGPPHRVPDFFLAHTILVVINKRSRYAFGNVGLIFFLHPSKSF